MQHISITADGTNVRITVDGIRLTDLHSFSLDYVKGSPLLFSCVADVGEPTPQRDRVMH